MASPLPMRTPTKKRPPFESEPGEGKAHEMKESKAEEVREGAQSEEESEEAPEVSPKGKNRKPLLKNSKNAKTKVPMDCEGCAGKKTGKCSGCAKAMKDGCGSYPMKKRSDALTAPEYLAACELGIQNQSRSYIRARLDTAERLDLKDKKTAISESSKHKQSHATVVLLRQDKAEAKELQERSDGSRSKKYDAAYANGFSIDYAQLEV